MNKTSRFLFKNLPPMPRNASHVNNRRTELCLAFCEDVQARLERLNIKDRFNKSRAIIYGLEVFVPKDIYFTKDGLISATAVDFDAHKVLTDEIAKYLGFNDGLIKFAQVTSCPINSEFWWFAITVQEMEKKDVKEWHEDTLISTLNSLGLASPILD